MNQQHLEPEHKSLVERIYESLISDVEYKSNLSLLTSFTGHDVLVSPRTNQDMHEGRKTPNTRSVVAKYDSFSLISNGIKYWAIAKNSNFNDGVPQSIIGTQLPFSKTLSNDEIFEKVQSHQYMRTLTQYLQKKMTGKVPSYQLLKVTNQGNIDCGLVHEKNGLILNSGSEYESIKKYLFPSN